VCFVVIVSSSSGGGSDGSWLVVVGVKVVGVKVVGGGFIWVFCRY